MFNTITSTPKHDFGKVCLNRVTVLWALRYIDFVGKYRYRLFDISLQKTIFFDISQSPGTDVVFVNFYHFFFKLFKNQKFLKFRFR